MRTVTKINLKGLNRFDKGLTTNRYVVAALKKWGKRYNKFTVDRFKRFSGGGGRWRKLKPHTVKYKKQNKNRKLVEFGDLLAQLKATIDASVIIKKTSSTLEVTAGVSSKSGTHPSGITIERLVEIHQLGLGRVPARQIIVNPPPEEIKKMRADLQEALEKWADATRT